MKVQGEGDRESLYRGRKDERIATTVSDLDLSKM